MPGILSADSYTIRKVHKYPINCSADELLNESFLTSKGNNFFEGSPSRGLFYSAGRRGARTSQRSSRRFHKKKKTEREKEKRITTLGLLISYEGKRQDIGSAKPQRGAFRIFFMIMINKRGKSGGR